MSEYVNPIQEVWRRATLLDTALSEMKDRGLANAEAERAYRVALAQRMLELKAAGYPATLIGDLARGDDTVAQLKCDRDCAEAIYDSAREAINVYKKQIDVLREQIDREWSRA